MNPKIFLVLTVIGDDRPGLVGELSALISQHQGNWLESSMSQLAGQFAGIVKIEIEAARAETIKTALATLAGLKVTAVSAATHPATHPATAPAPARRRMQLSLVGHDRIGIVREISQTLARHAANVEKLTTWTSTAAMSAELLFNAQAQLSLATNCDPRALISELERISDDLMVDLTLDES
jgi:glycine cleavage system regulatory protein